MSEVTIERITEVTPEILEAAQTLAPQLGSANQVTITADYLKRIVNNPDYYWLMARRTSDARLIGMASLVILPFPTNIRTTLENIVVDESARGNGTGTALCEEAIRIADGEKVNAIRTSIAKTNIPSQHMVEGVEFPIDEVIQHYEKELYRGPRF